MPYIAFLDMIGTRASALISNEEYTSAIDDFSNALKQVGDKCKCKIFGYSDNAYVEIEDIHEVIKFFRYLREILMNQHRYFTAAVDTGTLQAQQVLLKEKKGYSMKFTAPATVDIYMKQCNFCGIGISLSSSVVENMKKCERESEFCQSLFLKYPNEDDSGGLPVFDLSYDSVILEKLEFIISDYLLTAATNVRAGRYYITPIISMIKCLEKSVIMDQLDDLVNLLSLRSVPAAFRYLPYNDRYSLYFFFALMEYVLCLRERDKTIDATIIGEKIILGYGIEHGKLVESLPTISAALISNKNKKSFLNILYNMRTTEGGNAD